MSTLTFRRATEADLVAIIALLADDVLGAFRESRMPQDFILYRQAFAEIDADPNQLLAVAEEAGWIVGTLQLSFIPGLALRGTRRGQIEAVRVASDRRGGGLGQAMIEWAIGECRARGCALVQLTTDKGRADAHRFYEKLGFEPSHVGYKLRL
ncbi:MAG: N-acetyltransferase family protein [Sphingomonadales bacterium]